MLRMIKKYNPDKIYPSCLEQKWSNQEEEQLLLEISNGLSISDIAEKHDRTVGGINSRIRHIARELFVNNCPMDEIIEKTKLSEDEIRFYINKKQQKTKREWTYDEDCILVDELNEGKDITSISKTHDRDKYDIYMRIVKLASDYLSEQGQDKIDEACSIYQVSKDDILKYQKSMLKSEKFVIPDNLKFIEESFRKKKEETIDVLVEIRELLKVLVKKL